MVETDGAVIPLWYTGQCPKLDGEIVVLAPMGTDASLMGVDIATGNVAWKAPNPRGWKMSHASVSEMTVDGVRMYVYPALGGVMGVKADEPRRGEILWTTDAWKPSVQAPSTVDLGGGRLLVTAGYGSGSAVLRVANGNGEEISIPEAQRHGDGEWKAVVEQSLDRTVFGSEQQTPVLWDGLIYGVQPADGGAAKRELVALDATSMGRLWNSGADDRFGLGPYLLVNGTYMLLLSDDGTLTLAEVGRTGYRRVTRRRLFEEGRDAWGPMAFIGGKLLVRDERTLLCVDLHQKP